MVGNVSVGLRHTRLRDFTSEIYLPHLDPLEFRTSLRFDGIEPLVVQMHADVQECRETLGVPAP